MLEILRKHKDTMIHFNQSCIVHVRVVIQKDYKYIVDRGHF